VKSFILLSSIFVLIGCKGVGLLDKKLSTKSILTNNSWYEVCNNDKSRIYNFTAKNLDKTEYDNSDFTDFNYRKSYEVLSYGENSLKLKRNNQTYTCSAVYDVKDLTYIQVSCDGGDKVILINGWKSKSLAGENRAECF